MRSAVAVVTVRTNSIDQAALSILAFHGLTYNRTDTGRRIRTGCSVGQEPAASSNLLILIRAVASLLAIRLPVLVSRLAFLGRLVYVRRRYYWKL